jgi:hypothetical protein
MSEGAGESDADAEAVVDGEPFLFVQFDGERAGLVALVRGVGGGGGIGRLHDVVEASGKPAGVEDLHLVQVPVDFLESPDPFDLLLDGFGRSPVGG